MNGIEENPKGGGILLGIGLLVAAGIGIWAITRGGQAQNGCSGNNAMSRMLNAMLADTPLVKNLDNPEYMVRLFSNYRKPMKSKRVLSQ